MRWFQKRAPPLITSLPPDNVTPIHESKAFATTITANAIIVNYLYIAAGATLQIFETFMSMTRRWPPCNNVLRLLQQFKLQGKLPYSQFHRKRSWFL